MSASILKELASGSGLLYATDIAGTSFLIPGIPNNASGVNTIKNDALSRVGVGYDVSARGGYTFTAIGGADTITNYTINGVVQFDASVPIPVVLGQEEAAAQDLADKINAYIPTSGVNYIAYAVGNKTITIPVEGGSAYDGHVTILTQGVGNITGTAENIDGGSDAGAEISSINGRRYWLNTADTAAVGSLVGAEEITEFVVMRGLQSAVYKQAQTIASEAVTGLSRYSQISVLELGASGATDLNSINGDDFALNDIMIVKNVSGFTITVNDLSIGSGNIKLNPTTFGMVNDDYILTLVYDDDATDGWVWKEVVRTPLTVAADSITSTELANLSVGTAELQATSVTTAKIALANITNALMDTDSVDTSNIVDLAVTTAKIDDLAVTTGKIALLAVDTGQINDDAITTVKILDGNVTVAKVEDDLKTEVVHAFCSFETDYQGQVKVEVAWACEVIKVSAAVIKAMSGTDDAAIVMKNHAGTAMTGGQVDITLSSPIGNTFTSAPTANNTFSANETIIFELNKPTVGGVVWATAHVKRT
jgi:hypothetical protein